MPSSVALASFEPAPGPGDEVVRLLRHRARRACRRRRGSPPRPPRGRTPPGCRSRRRSGPRAAPRAARLADRRRARARPRPRPARRARRAVVSSANQRATRLRDGRARRPRPRRTRSGSSRATLAQERADPAPASPPCGSGRHLARDPAREVDRRRLAHLRDPQAVQHPAERPLLRALDRRVQVLRALAREPVERLEVLDRQPVEVGRAS